MTDRHLAPAAPDPLDGIAQTLDRVAVAAIAQLTFGASPVTMAEAFIDWGIHLAISPGKQMLLASRAFREAFRLADHAARWTGDANTEVSVLPPGQDRRFLDPAWRQQPYGLIVEAFLARQQWWHAATTAVSGVSRHHEAMINFGARQILDVVAPTNFFATNPVLQRKIAETGGKCLIDGAQYWLEDAQRLARGEPPVGAERFQVGETVAVTPGKVVLRNRLMELIQYAPTTGAVHPEPVLIVPAWIMKYYILDLSPENSLIRWLVGEGHTVFAISWHNPGSTDRNLDLDAYRRLGPMAALEAIRSITGAEQVHGVGYCLGGTLMAIAAAVMARDGDDRLATLTLFAAQTEFSEPGELGLFIDEAQINLLENMMWSRGYLDAHQMGGAFQMLRSNDLIWSRILQTYLMGEREPMTDLMAWNADGTRLPYAMHSQYLRQLFLNDDFAEGRFEVEGRAASLSAIHRPIFVVATERDHVAPWRSVHKIHGLTGAEIRFVLTSGGHNAGIVSEPGHAGRRYRVATRPSYAPPLDPDDWLAQADRRDGSWWIEWGRWLKQHSGERGPAPPIGNAEAGCPVLCDAPGAYVLER